MKFSTQYMQIGTFLMFVLTLALLAGCAGCAAPQEAAAPTEPPEPKKYTAAELSDLLETHVGKELRGQLVEITGKVSSVYAGDLKIDRETVYGYYLCDDIAEDVAVSPGDIVTVTGEIRSEAGNVWMDECILVSVVPNEKDSNLPKDDAEAADQESAEMSPSLALSIMQESYSGIADIEYHEGINAFTIIPTQAEFLAAVIALSNETTQTEETRETWDSVVESMGGLSKSLPGYIISLANPVNTENTLLMVMDGVVIFNFVEN